MAGLLVKSANNDEYDSSLFTGIKVAVAGSVLQIVAGPLDFLWHTYWGFDPYLFTPTHSMLIIGQAVYSFGMGIGAIRLFGARNTLTLKRAFLSSSKILSPLLIVSIAALWSWLNFMILWGTNGQGVAYTFHICPSGQIYTPSCTFVNDFMQVAFIPAFVLDSALGTLLFFTVKRILGRRGGATAVASLVILIQAATNIIFPANVLGGSLAVGALFFSNLGLGGGASLDAALWQYLALVVPAAILDFGVRNQVRGLFYLAAALSGPLSLYLDGRISVFSRLWSAEPVVFALLIPMFTGGFLGGALKVKFTHYMLATKSQELGGKIVAGAHR